MTLGIVPNGIKIEWNAVQNDVPIVNRVFVTTVDAPIAADLENAVDAAAAWFDDYKGFCHPSYVLQDITVTDVSVANGAQIITPYTTSNVGTASGAPAAANAAMVASLRTAKTGRSFRGRFYLGGLSNGYFTSAQNIDPDTTALFATRFSDFIDALQALGLTLVVVSNYANKVLRLVALATEIIAVIVDTKVDSQRRRTAN